MKLGFFLLIQLSCRKNFFSFEFTALNFIKGHGPGSPICLQLVEMQGGRIRVESREGEGSVFSFTLPRTSRDAEYGRPAEGPVLQPE